LARKYRYISADSHFECPPDQWTHRVPKEYRDRAPRRIRLSDGKDAIISEGRPITYGGTSWVGGRSPEEFNPTRIDYDGTPGCGTPEQRLREQDKDGIDAEVLFALGIRQPSVRDKNARLAIVQGFNDYMAEEYCAIAPDRLIGVGVLPDCGAEEDIAEMERCARMGLKAVCLESFPSGQRYPIPQDDKFWAAAVDMNMPITIHTSFHHHVQGRDVYQLKYPIELEGEERPPTDFVQRLARQGIYHCGALEAVQLILSGVFDRFPKLRIYWAENNLGWIPYYYEQMDQEYQTNRYWAERLLGLKPLSRLPSEYLREHAYWGFFEDAIGVRLRHEIGVGRVMWSTDFPHIVSRWPNSLKVMESQMVGVPEEEKYQMVAGNAIEFFHLRSG